MNSARGSDTNNNTIQENQSAEYMFFLLPDDEQKTLVEAHLEVKGGNAVLLYPALDDYSSSSAGSQKYNACFIQNGAWVSNVRKEIIRVSLGNQNLKNISLNAKNNLIKHALQKAGLIESSFMGPKKIEHTPLEKNLLLTFLGHVIRGKKNEAEAMLKEKENNLRLLLLETGRVTAYSGHIIEGTALQMALGARDFRIQNNEEGMVEMLDRYLKTLPDGEINIKDQVERQFPNGLLQDDNLEYVPVLRAVVDKIKVSKKDEDCEKVLQIFRDFLKPKDVIKTKDIIKTGTHFNDSLLFSALRHYNDNFNNFGGRNSRKNNLFWRKVIGYIQRFLPACYAQAMCQGLHFIISKDQKLTRSLNITIDSKNHYSFFPLVSSGLAASLGYEYAIGFQYGAKLDHTHGAVASDLFEKLKECKRNELVDYIVANALSGFKLKI